MSALVLHATTGASGADCVQHVRLRRANALTNAYFVRALRRLTPRTTSG